MLSQYELEIERFEGCLKAWRDIAIWESTFRELEQQFAQMGEDYRESRREAEQRRREVEHRRNEMEKRWVTELVSQVCFFEQLLNLPATPKDQLEVMPVERLKERVGRLCR